MHVIVQVCLCICVWEPTCLCLGPSWISIFDSMTFIYITIKWFPTALSAWYFQVRTLGKRQVTFVVWPDCDTQCWLAFFPQIIGAHGCLSRQKLHITDSELFLQGQRYNLAVAALPSALNMQSPGKNNGMSSAIFLPAADTVNCNIV